MEAFPVQTPELKSEQGVFGNPFFMHGEMDVSEPVALGIIDYLIDEPATITYTPDFPHEAADSVKAAGLSDEYSYYFLGKKKDDSQKPEAPASGEQPGNGKDKSGK